MDALQFAYWLQGFAELNEQPPSAEQWQSIRDHLALVFRKVTPPLSDGAKHGPLSQRIDDDFVRAQLRRSSVTCSAPAAKGAATLC